MLILRIIGIAPSRYHAWRRAAVGCGLDDRSSCPRSSPYQLTPDEVGTIKEMVLDPNLRHMPVRTLSLFAQRAGRVFASATTWARLVRQRGWRRLRTRVHPTRPTLGVRAARPNEYWHIDVTVLKLLDGTKAYLHAVIDNYSRKILAWTLAARLDPVTTCEVLVAAGRHLGEKQDEPPGARPTVVADSGVENVNHAVDAILVSAKPRRVLAQVEVAYSNPIIEAWWRSLKHQWLYLNTLDTSVAHRGAHRLLRRRAQRHDAALGLRRADARRDVRRRRGQRRRGSRRRPAQGTGATPHREPRGPVPSMRPADRSANGTARVAPGLAAPGLPQIRTCRTTASGSSMDSSL